VKAMWLVGVAALATVASADAGPKVSATELAAAERLALKDPTHCGRPKESVIYACQIGQDHWSMCYSDATDGAVLRRVRGGRVIDRIWSEDGPVAARDYFDEVRRTRTTEFTLSKGGARYTVFERQYRDGETTGVLIHAAGQADRELVCRKKGEFTVLDPKVVPTVFSNVMTDK